jgi:hypothetical protein
MPNPEAGRTDLYVNVTLYRYTVPVLHRNVIYDSGCQFANVPNCPSPCYAWFRPTRDLAMAFDVNFMQTSNQCCGSGSAWIQVGKIDPQKKWEMARMYIGRPKYITIWSSNPWIRIPIDLKCWTGYELPKMWSGPALKPWQQCGSTTLQPTDLYKRNFF